MTARLSPASMRHARTLFIALAAIGVAQSALAVLATSNCGRRIDNPQAYEFCMRQTGQQSANPVVAAQPPLVTPPGNTPPPKNKKNVSYQQCLTQMKTKQHMAPAAASAYCADLLN